MLTIERIKKLSQVTSAKYRGKTVRVPTKIWRTGSVPSHSDVIISATMAEDIAIPVRVIAEKLLEDEST